MYGDPINLTQSVNFLKLKTVCCHFLDDLKFIISRCLDEKIPKLCKVILAKM